MLRRSSRLERRAIWRRSASEAGNGRRRPHRKIERCKSTDQVRGAAVLKRELHRSCLAPRETLATPFVDAFDQALAGPVTEVQNNGEKCRWSKLEGKPGVEQGGGSEPDQRQDGIQDSYFLSVRRPHRG